MIVEAGKRGCAREVMILAAALTIQDPRERPQAESGKQQLAAEKHKRFVDENSDFTGYLNLWRYLQEKQQELSSTAFRRLCKAEFINYLRVREWQDLFTQLRQLAPGKSAGHPGGHGAGTSGSADGSIRWATTTGIHMSLLTGLLSHIGLYDQRKREYAGARGTRFAIFPGSALFKKSPDWVMAAELVETSRLWARVAAKFDPLWAEQVAPDLVKRSYSEPHWSKKMGSVMAHEKVTLYGVPDRAAAAGSTTAGSTPSSAASCSSGTPWWRATGARTTSSSTATRRCWPRWRSWKRGCAAATCAWTTRRSSSSTTNGWAPR